MRNSVPNVAREKVIRSRQDPPQWGAMYVPGQLATREEAPDYSRPSKVQCSWLGRDVHLMSEPELYFYLFARWLGCFADMHEGRMLHPEPMDGLLSGGPFGEQNYLASHSGTVMTAERLGLLEFHPLIRGDRGWMAFPMLADLLFYGKDKKGFYSINWCIKKEPADFVEAFKGNSQIERAKSDETHQARLLIEEEVLAEAAVRTIHLSLRDLPENLRNNLRFLSVYLNRRHSISDTQAQDFTESINQRIPKQVPLIETINTFMGAHGGALFDYTVVLYQAIWRGDIKCDLNRIIQIDLPLKPEQQNDKKKFEPWTGRSSV